MQDKEYIAYKAVLAIKEVLTTTHKFTEPEAAQQVMNLYKTENSSILSWVSQKKISTDHMKETKFDELFAEYGVWCDVNGYKRVGSSRFEQELSEEFNLKREDDYLIDK
jgi:phage/plasmid-associated DNA primase